jgi:tRNA 2-thiouridine synthesizing protein B
LQRHYAPTFKMLELYDIEEIYVCAVSLAERGLTAADLLIPVIPPLLRKFAVAGRVSPPTSASEVPVIQLILNSPFMSQDLELALRYRMEGDLVVLMQDAVMAAAAPGGASAWQTSPYVMKEDLQARGLSSGIGMELDMPGLIRLIAEHGSPQTWGG